MRRWLVTSDLCKPRPSALFSLCPSVFSVLKALEFFRDTHNVESFTTENTEKTSRRIDHFAN